MPCGAWKQPAWPNPPLTAPDGEPAPARSQRPYQQAADTPDQPPLNANRSNSRHRRHSLYTIPDYLRGHRAGSSACRFTGLPNTYDEGGAMVWRLDGTYFESCSCDT